MYDVVLMCRYSVYYEIESRVQVVDSLGRIIIFLCILFEYYIFACASIHKSIDNKVG